MKATTLVPPKFPIPYYNNCVLYMPFQTGIIKDYSKYHHVATNVGVKKSYSTALGGQSLFWGTDDTYIEIPHHPSLSILGDMTMYISFVPKNLGNSMVLFYKSASGSAIPKPYGLIIHSSKKLQVMRGDGVNYYWQMPNLILENDKAYSVVFTMKSINATQDIISPFINGVTTTKIPADRYLADSGLPLLLGIRNDLAADYKGYIQEVGLWNTAFIDEFAKRVTQYGLY